MTLSNNTPRTILVTFHPESAFKKQIHSGRASPSRRAAERFLIAALFTAAATLALLAFWGALAWLIKP